jgi:hypothetical protein
MVMKLRLALLLAVGAALLMASAAGADQNYSDPAGDAGVGTDIVGITVGNDAAGAISLRIATATTVPFNHALMLFIDADKNPATGGDGDEFVLIGLPIGTIFLAWNGSTFVETFPASFRFSSSGTTTTFAISRGDLANTSGFNFFVASASIDPPNFIPRDTAGYFTYDLVFTQCANGKDDDGDGKVDSQDLGCSSSTDDNESDDPVNIRLGKAAVAPAKPKAGGIAVVSTATTRVETGEALASATVACTARVAGKALRGTGSVVNGRAQCRYRLPLTSKGKLVSGAVQVTYKAATAKAAFSFRVAK